MSERTRTIGLIALAAVLGGLFSLTLHHPQVIPGWEHRKLLESRETLYNNIYIFQAEKNIALTFGYNKNLYVESLYNPADDLDLPAPYTPYMTAGLIYPADIHSILEIGVGGGRTSWYLHRSLPDVSITSVELDPQVLELAKKYFGVRDEKNFSMVAEDGRLYLANTPDHYDIILIDAYRGPFVPFHMMTREFYQLAKSHLTEGGAIVQNIEPSTMLFDSAVQTIHAVFANVDFYKLDGNVVTIAYDGPARSQAELAKIAGMRQAKDHFRYSLPHLLQDRRVFVPDSGFIDPKAKVLTDDFAPVESLKSIESHNRKWPEPSQ